MSLVAKLIYEHSEANDPTWRAMLSKAVNTLLTVEDWREVGDTGEPAFANSWVNYDTGFATCAFYKDPWGRVHIKGLVKSGTLDTTIFTLPAGYRPSLELIFTSNENGSFGRVDVFADGTIKQVDGASTTWISLNISFRAA